MTTDPSREAFEKWAKEEGYDTARTYDTDRSCWVWLNPMTADLWKAWQAAMAQLSAQAVPQCDKLIAALCPDFCDARFPGDRPIMRQLVRDALPAAPLQQVE
ncbi:MAG: hypothetical protein RSF42_10930 [Comamonas sp.]